jgi:hypothetical protein
MGTDPGSAIGLPVWKAFCSSRQPPHKALVEGGVGYPPVPGQCPGQGPDQCPDQWLTRASTGATEEPRRDDLTCRIG